MNVKKVGYKAVFSKLKAIAEKNPLSSATKGKGWEMDVKNDVITLTRHGKYKKEFKFSPDGKLLRTTYFLNNGNNISMSGKGLICVCRHSENLREYPHFRKQFDSFFDLLHNISIRNLLKK